MLFIDSNKKSSLGINLLRRYKKFTTIMAVLLLLSSLACMIFPLYSGVIVSNLAGLLITLCGIYSVVMGFIFRKHNTRSFISSLIFGIIYVGVGYGFIISPSFGINTLSLLFCCLFILAGLSRITMGLKDREMTGRLICIFIGLMDIVIAFVWINSNEETNFLITITFIGLEMLFSAWFFLRLCYSLQKV
ncbi:DUF308 domain-containing protein [Pantoea agglomerans]